MKIKHNLSNWEKEAQGGTEWRDYKETCIIWIVMASKEYACQNWSNSTF